jgi:hypothetical protein
MQVLIIAVSKVEVESNWSGPMTTTLISQSGKLQSYTCSISLPVSTPRLLTACALHYDLPHDSYRYLAYQSSAISTATVL